MSACLFFAAHTQVRLAAVTWLPCFIAAGTLLHLVMHDLSQTAVARADLEGLNLFFSVHPVILVILLITWIHHYRDGKRSWLYSTSVVDQCFNFDIGASQSEASINHSLKKNIQRLRRVFCSSQTLDALKNMMKGKQAVVSAWCGYQGQHARTGQDTISHLSQGAQRRRLRLGLQI